MEIDYTGAWGKISRLPSIKRTKSQSIRASENPNGLYEHT